MFNARNIDITAMVNAKKHQDQLTKPAGSLGVLETISIRLAGIFGEVPEKINNKHILLFAGDHGIASQGVSAYPQEVTGQMLMNFAKGGAAINVLAKHAGAQVAICDIGTLADSRDMPNIIDAKVASGTNDISEGPAMVAKEAEDAVYTGRRIAGSLIDEGCMLIGLGDMGIGNTSIATAITSVITGAPIGHVVGMGTGIDETKLLQKISIIEKAIAINKPIKDDGFDILRKIGGYEFAGQTGAILACAEKGVPVIIDGFISCAAALIAGLILPESREFMLASHLSAEPGHKIAADYIGLTPMLHLDMRLGEGTGAALAMTIVDAAVAIYHNMATFDNAGVDRSQEHPVA